MTVLECILEDVRANLNTRKRTVSEYDLKTLIKDCSPVRNFQAALRAPGLRFIAEIKKRSPSKGLLRQPFHVPDLASKYSTASADAISVLTETNHFGGSLSDLNSVTSQTHLPVLRKDFIVDPYQIYEARAHGADAVLLIAAILERTQLRDLHDLATDLHLDCLVEIYDPIELDKLDFSQVSILGVNNRNLHTFKVDIEHSLRVFELVDENLIKVSESGLQSPKDLAYLYQHGVDAVLIGETFMRADDPGVALQSLRQETNSLLTAEIAECRAK